MTNKEAIIVLKNIAWFGKIYDQEQTEEAVDMAINALTAQPERKKGKWILQDGYRCSFYNYKLQITGIPNTCPNCGASMEG